MQKYIVLLTPALGYQNGGVNAFNYDLARHLGPLTSGGDTQVLIIAAEDFPSTLGKAAEAQNLQVETLSKSGFNLLVSDLAPLRAKIDTLPPEAQLFFVGHDVLTGDWAVYLKEIYGKRAVAIVVHHMDYEAYQVIKGDSSPQENRAKLLGQRTVLEAADFVIGVGTVLAASARRKTTRPVFELVPGLQVIDPVATDGKLVGIAFGRYDARTDRLKQMLVAGKAFAELMREQFSDFPYGATLKVIGIDEAEGSAAFVGAATTEGDPFINIVPMPYSEDRAELFRELRSASVCLMLSVHEGFGLAGFEAIAAGVPLILSVNSGLHAFLAAQLPDEDLKSWGVYPLQIRGSQSGEPAAADVSAVRLALWEVYQDAAVYKAGVLKLREKLLPDFGWPQAAEAFLRILAGIEIAEGKEQHEQARVAEMRQAVLSSRLGKEPQPLLDLSEDGQGSVLVYRSRSVALVGRDEALQSLNDFVAGEEKFKWWAVTGAGGMGKSRLALETMLALMNEQGWHSGFISGKELTDFDWAGWKPRYDTLITVDYAARHSAALVVALETMGKQAGRYHHRVRLLLLERSAEMPWALELNYLVSKGQVIAPFRPEPLELMGLSDKALLAIADRFVDLRQLKLTRLQLLGEIKKIDSSGKPLFAIMHALQRRAGEPDSDSGRGLLDAHLERQDREIWQPELPDAALRAKFKNLAAYITMTGGIDRARLAELLTATPALFPPAEASFAVFGALDLAGGQFDRLAPIEPDIIGEYFVRKHLTEAAPFTLAPRTVLDQLVALAWQREPERMQDFVGRLLVDFPDTVILPFAPVPAADASEVVQSAWCALQSNIIAVQFRTGAVPASVVNTTYAQQIAFANERNIPEGRLALISSLEFMLEWLVRFGTDDETVTTLWSGVRGVLAKQEEPETIKKVCHFPVYHLVCCYWLMAIH